MGPQVFLRADERRMIRELPGTSGMRFRLARAAPESLAPASCDTRQFDIN